jgi:hypothetical protein
MSSFKKSHQLLQNKNPWWTATTYSFAIGQTLFRTSFYLSFYDDDMLPYIPGPRRITELVRVVLEIYENGQHVVLLTNAGHFLPPVSSYFHVHL